MFDFMLATILTQWELHGLRIKFNLRIYYSNADIVIKVNNLTAPFNGWLTAPIAFPGFCVTPIWASWKSLFWGLRLFQ